ncbi:MAG: hypothetical protein KY464_13420 [Gemmatimonadetes bacterium]|nr:hypothetical protein [Gemmatimonadota bacterium]
MRLPLVVALLLCAAPLPAQSVVSSDAYQDPRARELVRLARQRRAAVDTRITSYQTEARERTSVRLTAAGFERLIFRRETAARIHWTPDTVRIEVLGAREAQPLVKGGVDRGPPDIAGLTPNLAFEPTSSEVLFRVDSTTIQHPLEPGRETHYRFASGDSTSIHLPNGRVVRLRELRVTARRPDPKLINGSFWVDAESHAVVRAGFRLSRGYSSAGRGVAALAPEVTGELDHVAIDYGLWDLRWWLPRTMVARGVLRVAGMRLGVAYERSYEDYRVQGDTFSAAAPPPVELAGSAVRPCRPETTGSITISIGDSRAPAVRDSAWNAGWDRTAARLARRDTATSDGAAGSGNGCRRPYVITRAEGVDLVNSPELPTNIYEEGEGVVSALEMAKLAELLNGIPATPWSLARLRLQLLTPELVRYNRVEGLSLGARAVLALGPAEARAELRAGTSGELGGRLSGAYSSPALRTELAGYRGLEAVQVAAQPFSLGGSASALLLGRDDNDYFRGTGAELRLAPAAARPQRWDLRLFGERQEAVRARSDRSLRGVVDGGFEPRSNLAADRIDQAGAILRLRGGRGDDPAGLRTRAELELHGETGHRTFARPALRLFADRLLAGGIGLGLGVTAATGIGDLPAQRAWQIGGASTVRGHDAAAMRGESLLLGRAELTWGLPVARLSLFGDAGWAGEREAVTGARPLRGIGLGAALLDNLVRLDMARGIGGGGTRLYLRIGGGL